MAPVRRILEAGSGVAVSDRPVSAPDPGRVGARVHPRDRNDPGEATPRRGLPGHRTRRTYNGFPDNPTVKAALKRQRSCGHEAGGQRIACGGTAVGSAARGHSDRFTGRPVAPARPAIQLPRLQHEYDDELLVLWGVLAPKVFGMLRGQGADSHTAEELTRKYSWSCAVNGRCCGSASDRAPMPTGLRVLCGGGRGSEIKLCASWQRVNLPIDSVS
jgi:hypothetical protein